MIPQVRTIGCPLLVLASLAFVGCGGDEKAPPRDPTAPSTTHATTDVVDAPKASRIQFVDGFEAGAAKAKPGDVLFVYVGIHDPT